MNSRVHLLVDGAVARGTALLSRVREQGALALYADLGDMAAEVGPWLLPDSNLDAAGATELPLRHGVSELRSGAEPKTLAAHLQTIRHIDTADGQRFYARLADARALRALWLVLHASQRHELLGPIDTWEWIDRYGQRQQLQCDPSLGAHAGRVPLGLDDAQLARLLELSLADQLCAALVELDEPALRPDTMADQFALIEQHALPYLNANGIEHWPLQRAVARQFVLHGAGLAQLPEFMAAVAQARSAGPETLDRWHAPG
jgi:hypothetical protein